MMASRRYTLQEDIRFRILRLLQENLEWSQRELANAVGVSNGGVHYLLKALVEKGLVKLGNFASSTDKQRNAYVLTLTGIAERAALTGCSLLRKMAEYGALVAEIDTLRDELGSERVTSMHRRDQ
jgi:EPS-associated MarR family transcriptional regulator